MISKKLLSTILCVEILDIENGIPIYAKGLVDNHINYSISGKYGEFFSANVYELMAKAKEWAIGEEYCLSSYIHDYGRGTDYCCCEILIPLYGSSHSFGGLLKTTDGTTEHEAVFRACEWILQRKSNG